MKPIALFIAGLVTGVFALTPRSVCALDEDMTMQGGGTTVEDTSRQAYNHTATNITDAAALALHDVGQTGFLRNFGKVKIRGAVRLGPTFNAPSCASCHGGNGRGTGAINPRGTRSDTVVKVSRAHGQSIVPGGPVPVPGIGLQVRDHGLAPATAEANVGVRWRELKGSYGDGSGYSLRSPSIALTKARKRFPKDLQTSLRRAPPVFGSGLLDAVGQGEITSRADPFDADNDGISGRVNIVWDLQSNVSAIGRFGFKASTPSLKQLVAAAYATDMGVTNPFFPRGSQTPEISMNVLDATTFYTATLAVPMARDQGDPVVARGRTLFLQLGCSACHSPTLSTGEGAHPALTAQTIHPFTDLLLHDMGEGLADNRPEFAASGTEWRTTPLWGIGLTDQVLNGRPGTYLHDGRARSLEEAIVWHGGEAAAVKDRFVSSSAEERTALIRFLRSL